MTFNTNLKIKDILENYSEKGSYIETVEAAKKGEKWPTGKGHRYKKKLNSKLKK